ncbi:reverse transcriptase domain-containing protein [Microcoleus sp. Pol12B5]|uniref:reverse transcriptase domain-containing protein n=1 Tax=Microcoleus sp. Pol12B5 TaxID=3055396 RepID=UPI002FD1ACBF
MFFLTKIVFCTTKPGRSCHDAIRQIKVCIQHKAKFVLDADIAKCFDRINHYELLQKLNIKGKVRRQVKSWLKSGVIDDGVFTATSEGTPQGGVISPLLANIALHGLEKHLENKVPGYGNGYLKKSISNFGKYVGCPNIIRYADDFVILCEEKVVSCCTFKL